MSKLCDAAILFFCRVGWAGLSPRAPGTVGSFTALLLAPWLFLALNPLVQALLLVFIFILGGLAACRVETILGRKDPSQVVIDELLGQWTALLPVGLLLVSPQMSGLDMLCSFWPWMLTAFALFRLFDILKPWPVGASENWLPGGFGVMLDDLFAGLMAGALLYASILLFG
ncbi:MAG: phosphatidylglycerophosphatase A [Desulfovibrionaceae bacterium]|nr:phosphatidylglycerophosphatase A [Desulfovibrionaceae bacterium]